MAHTRKEDIEINSSEMKYLKEKKFEKMMDKKMTEMDKKLTEHQEEIKKEMSEIKTRLDKVEKITRWKKQGRHRRDQNKIKD